MSNIQKVTQEGIAKLDGAALAVLGQNNIQGFQKAFIVSEAIGELTDLLNADYMKPIMKLQGTSLGFRTDKDKDGGYPEPVVKRCLIEAILKGLQPVGNQFNIIAGNMYPTKEGCGELLKKLEGLVYKITAQLPQVNQAKTGAAIKMKIEYTYQGKSGEDSPEFPLKIDAYTSVDAMIGKGTRKARMWLYNFITGSDLVDGDVQDADFKIVDKPAKKTEAEIETGRWVDLLNDCNTPNELMKYKDQLPTDNPAVLEAYEKKLEQFLS